MARFCKKPIVVEARQLTADNQAELSEWCGGCPCDNGDLLIFTLEGDLRASVGDHIIQGIRGEFYPCKPDIFEATYEPVALTSKESGL